MAERNFKVDQAIEIVYQAPNAESDLDIRADVYDQNKAPKLVDIQLTEVGDTGTYRDSFTPDAQGEWQAIIYKFVDSDTRDGQVVKRYSVGAHNVESVGAGVAGVDTKAGNIQDKVDEIDADVAILDDKVVDLDNDVAGVQTTVNEIKTSVGSLDTPPMVS